MGDYKGYKRTSKAESEYLNERLAKIDAAKSVMVSGMAGTDHNVCAFMPPKRRMLSRYSYDDLYDPILWVPIDFTKELYVGATMTNINGNQYRTFFGRSMIEKSGVCGRKPLHFERRAALIVAIRLVAERGADVVALQDLFNLVQALAHPNGADMLII